MSWGTNVLVGQSGGPTAVINSSLAGVYEAAKALGAAHVYGMEYGIQGLLQGKIVDLDDRLDDKMEIELPVQAAQPRHGRTPLCAAV